jgi:hypothetical protein
LFFSGVCHSDGKTDRPKRVMAGLFDC